VGIGIFSVFHKFGDFVAHDSSIYPHRIRYLLLRVAAQVHGVGVTLAVELRYRQKQAAPRARGRDPDVMRERGGVVTQAALVRNRSPASAYGSRE